MRPTQTSRQYGSMTIETYIYEDGYVRVALLDQLGLEIASHDSTASTTRTALEVASILTDLLIAEND